MSTVPPTNDKKRKRPVGAGLSLDKFAELGVSKFDKRKKIERAQKQQIIRHSQYSKLKKKLEAQGLLASTKVKDSVAELEALDGRVPHLTADAEGGTNAHAARAALHGQAGPRKAKQPAAPDAPTKHQNRPAALSRATGDGARCFPSRKRPTEAEDTEDVEEQPSERPKQPRGDHGRDRLDRGSGDQEHQRGGKGGGSRQGNGGKQQHGQQGKSGGEQRGSSRPKSPYGRGRPEGEGQEGKKLSQLQRLAQQVAEEKAAKQQEKEEAMNQRQERLQRVAAVEKSRKEQKHIHFKRTSKGQPLMRYRMEKLLSKLQGPDQ